MRDDRVQRCLVCGAWMVDVCHACQRRRNPGQYTPAAPEAVDYDYAQITGLVETLTAERDHARRIAVALEQEIAEMCKPNAQARTEMLAKAIDAITNVRSMGNSTLAAGEYIARRDAIHALRDLEQP